MTAPALDQRALGFVAYGDPAPQGSKRHVGNGRMIEMSKKLKPWRAAVVSAAERDMLTDDWTTATSAVRVGIVFFFDRPRVHYRTGSYANCLRANAPLWPSNRGTGDIDKCARATLDALVTAKVIADDSQVADLRVRKQWTGEGLPCLDIPGAVIRVQVLR